MSDSYDGPLLAGHTSDNEKGRPKFWAAFLRLYRHNDTWRGAVDMALIGWFIAFLAFVSPSLLDSGGKILSSAFVTEQENQTSPPSAQTAANFSPAADDSKNHLAQPSALPLPSKSAFKFQDAEWVQPLSADDQKTLEDAISFIGADNQRALELIEEKASAGDSNFQFLKGVVFANEALKKHQNEQTDTLEKAVFWYKEASLLGQPEAQYQLGQIYRIGGPSISPNIPESIKWYEMGIENSNNKSGKSENELGRLYEKGEQVSVDIEKAFDLYSKGAEKGNAFAQANLAAMYYNAVGRPRDIQKAEELTRKAAENGNAMAQLNLATMYYRGRIGGVPDYTEYIKWMGLAAEQGDINALIGLGDFYREGKPGFEIDHKKAAHYYRLAALKKDGKAQFLYASMFEQGLGVPKDLIQAYVYYSLSYNSGNFTPALSARRKLEGTMSPAELDHAKKMVEALKQR